MVLVAFGAVSADVVVLGRTIVVCAVHKLFFAFLACVVAQVQVAHVPYASSYAERSTLQRLATFVAAEMPTRINSGTGASSPGGGGGGGGWSAANASRQILRRWPAVPAATAATEAATATAAAAAAAAAAAGGEGEVDGEGEVGVKYVFDAGFLERVHGDVLDRVVTLDLQETLLPSKWLPPKPRAASEEDEDDDDDDDDTGRVLSFSRGLVRLKQFAMGGALSGAAPHFHGFAANVLAHGARLWFFAGKRACKCERVRVCARARARERRRCMFCCPAFADCVRLALALEMIYCTSYKAAAAAPPPPPRLTIATITTSARR